MDQSDALPDIVSSTGEAGASGDTAMSQGDQPDARSLSLFGGGSSQKQSTSQPLVEKMDFENEYTFRYNMQFAHRGTAIIINNRNFESKTGMNERSGTDVDAAQLYKIFKLLEFNVQMHNNLTCTGMLKTISEASKKDYRDADCFLLAILSHGDEGVVYGTDGIIPLETLIKPFKGDHCPSLVGKPKIFIIQACRGNKLDHGAEVADADSEIDNPQQKLPTEADILMAFSTVPGYFSWRNSTKGSWFVQALCKVLERYGREKEIMWILTRASYLVAYEFESNASKEYMNKKKQIPCIMSMLTKELYFHPKKQ